MTLRINTYVTGEEALIAAKILKKRGAWGKFIKKALQEYK